MKKILLCLLLLIAIQPARALDWNAQRGQFTFCMLAARSGFWVGTEDNGLWRRDARGVWTQFGEKDGLGSDSVRCLLERGGQIWAGHTRGGLSIWDGANWSHVGVFDGLPDARVNDLALDTESGDVWVATDGGLCRWNDDGGWTTPDSVLTRVQIVGLACARGQVWAATACDGLLQSSDRGQSWRAIHGSVVQPNQATGVGLPSDVLNDVAVDELGQIWVATIYGLAKSSDDGTSWFYLRGADWEQNVKGSASGLVPGQGEARVEPPGEDWVQSLATDGEGHIWLGFRQQGAEMRDIGSNELIFATRFFPGQVAMPGNQWVRAIYAMPNNRAITAGYGSGLSAILNADFPKIEAQIPQPKLAIPGAFPTLNATQIAALKPDIADAKGAFLNMDWQTRGDWVGRYGESLAWIYELPWQREFRRDPRVELAVELGPHAKDEVGGPYTYISYRESKNPDVLYNPAIGTRLMDEINDGTWRGDAYPLSWDGPGLWVSVKVPAGAHRLSVYFYNSNGHDGSNAYRDFVLQLKPWSEDKADAEAAPDLARCRVSDFWGGAYANFAVSGPGQYWLKIGRNRSFVAKFSGVFVDRIGDTTTPLQGEIPRPAMQGVNYNAPTAPAPDGNENAIVTAVRAAWQKLDEAAPVPGIWHQRLQLWRAAQAAGASEQLLANWRWKLALLTPDDRDEFDDTMARIEAKRTAKAPKANSF